MEKTSEATNGSQLQRARYFQNFEINMFKFIKIRKIARGRVCYTIAQNLKPKFVGLHVTQKRQDGQKYNEVF